MFCVIVITFSGVIKKLDMGHYAKGTDLILLVISLSVNVGSFSIYTLSPIQ